MASHPPPNGVHSKTFWWQFEEFFNLINVETDVFVVARGEVNFLR
jgi:hypothetical protein